MRDVDVLKLLPMTLARPRDALALARSVVAGRPDAATESIARHAAGIVLRDLGELDAARFELRRALRLARGGHREADVLTTLGTVLVMSGRTRAGLAAIDEAVGAAEGVMRGTVLMRRGGILHQLGRHAAALEDLRRALAIFRRTRDVIWEARTRTWLGLASLALGATERADAEFAAAEELFARTDQELEVAKSVHNRALVAFRSGDLPAALRHLDAAAARYAELRVPMPDLTLDRCDVLLAAGLPAEAFAEVDAALAEPHRRQPTQRAELMLAAARAALAAQLLTIAAERGLAARQAFSAQRRGWWEAHARLVELQARFLSGRAPRAAEAARVASWLTELRSDEAPQAWLLAGRIALAHGRPASGHDVAGGRDAAAGRPAGAGQDTGARRYLDAAAAVRRRKVPALTRVTGWHAAALRAEAAGDQRAVFAACRRGFEVLGEHRLTLGASELRARATAHGAELAAIALRAALRTGSPRVLLEWSERWRATELAAPAPRPVADPELRSNLAALREVTRRLDEVRAVAVADLQVAPLESHLLRERARLESSIRALSRTRPAQASGVSSPELVSRELLRSTGDACLLEIVPVAGRLHVLVCGAGRVRRFAAGDASDVAREVDFARFGLDRFARDQLGEPASAAIGALNVAGHRLEELLLGEAAGQLGDRPAVIVPPGRLHAVPWSLLPSMRDRVFSISPSARAWLQVSRIPSFGTEKVLVYGPELGNGRAEVETLARNYGEAVVLGAGTATAERVLAALDGARLAHIAAHGVFRADSPLFSSLLLDDGPLTGYDLERVRRAPYQLVLPACESGVQAPAGADELLGLAAALLPRGTAGIVASVVRVNDEAASRVMLALHASLRDDVSLAVALRDARRAVADDPLATAAAWSFVALGA